ILNHDHNTGRPVRAEAIWCGWRAGRGEWDGGRDELRPGKKGRPGRLGGERAGHGAARGRNRRTGAWTPGHRGRNRPVSRAEYTLPAARPHPFWDEWD